MNLDTPPCLQNHNKIRPNHRLDPINTVYINTLETIFIFKKELKKEFKKDLLIPHIKPVKLSFDEHIQSRETIETSFFSEKY